MTNKELKRLSRAELLEMLIAQVKENEALRGELEQVKTELENRAILIHESGSMAEAAMRLNDVFQAADAAASLYLENLKRQNEQLKEEAKRRCAQVEEEARKRCAELEEEARRRCTEMIVWTEQRCKARYPEFDASQARRETGGEETG